MFPGEEFLPKGPDPEDVVLDDPSEEDKNNSDPMMEAEMGGQVSAESTSNQASEDVV